MFLTKLVARTSAEVLLYFDDVLLDKGTLGK